MRWNIKYSGKSSFSTFGASKYFCFCLSDTQNAPLDAVLDHVARHELDATLEVLGELVLGPVQVPDESLESVQLPEEVLRRPGAVTAMDPNIHTNTDKHTGQRTKVTLLGRGGVGGIMWQVQRRMLFLHT